MSREYFVLTRPVPRPHLAPAPAASDLRSGRLLDPRAVISLSGVALYLAVSPAVARGILADRAITRRVGGRYHLSDLWRSLWSISHVSDPDIATMCEPLLTVSEMAEIAGVSERTIRRAGDTRSPTWALPRHVDLSPRVRRYLRPLVAAWALQIPPEAWLTPAPRRPILGGALQLRSDAKAESTTNGQHANEATK